MAEKGMAEQGARETQVGQELLSLTHSIEELKVPLQALEKRLASVLYSDATPSQNEAKKSMEPAGVPLAIRIRDLTLKVQAVTMRLQDLTNRIEL